MLVPSSMKVCQRFVNFFVIMSPTTGVVDTQTGTAEVKNFCGCEVLVNKVCERKSTSGRPVKQGERRVGFLSNCLTNSRRSCHM